MQATLIRLFRRSSRSPEQYFSPAHYEGYFTRQNMLRKISVESSLGHQILHRHRINAVARLSFTSKTNYAAAQLAKQVESKVVRIGKAVKETEQAVAGPWTAKRMRLPAVSSASVDQRLAQEDRTLWEELEAEGLLLESHQPARVALPPSMHRLPRTNIPGRSLSTSTTSTWSIARERLRTLPPVRPYSVIAANRAAALAAQIPPETIVDLKQIMNDLRDLELLDKLQGVKPKSATSFKDATRELHSTSLIVYIISYVHPNRHALPTLAQARPRWPSGHLRATPGPTSSHLQRSVDSYLPTTRRQHCLST